MTAFPLTRAAQVLSVLRAGGCIITTSANGCQQRAALHDANGAPVDAWLNAIDAAARQCHPALTVQRGDGTITTRLELAP